MRHTTLITLLAAPLALAACDSGQDTAEMEDMPMAEDAMMMDGQDMPMADTGNAMQSECARHRHRHRRRSGYDHRRPRPGSRNRMAGNDHGVRSR